MIDPTMFPATSANLWRVPFPRNPHFVGRSRALDELHADLRKTAPAARVQVLTGMAGVGKTQLAIEYAHRHRGEYRIVWWVRAEDEASLQNDFLQLAERLRPAAALATIEDRLAQSLLPPTELPPTAEARAHVLRALDERSDWLLIFDGAAEPAWLDGYVPAARAGHVIVTSRNPNWREVGSVVPVGPLDRSEAIFFLTSRTGRNESFFVAGQLAKALGDLPLALDQAAGLIEQMGLSFEQYLRRFELHWAELLSRGRAAAPGREVHDSVALSLEMSFQQLESARPASAELLNLCAFLGAEPIRLEWLRNGSAALPKDLGRLVDDTIALDDAIGGLLQFSLTERADGDAAIRFHRLVAAVARHRLSAEQLTEWSHRALRMVDLAFRFDAQDPRTWQRCAAMLPHALAVVEHATQGDVTTAAAVGLLNEIGQCQHRLARYDDAITTLESAMNLGTKIYGPTNPRLSAIANNLGRALYRMRYHLAARLKFEWALATDTQAYGQDHPHVAEVMNNYGMCLVRLGDIEEALAQFNGALGIYRNHFGADDPRCAGIQTNLGFAMLKTRRPGAREMLEHALFILSGAYGEDHPEVAGVLTNLADVAATEGKLDEARTLLLRAIGINERICGRNHPDVARDVARLGLVLMDQGEPREARVCFERALAIDESVYGPMHVQVAERLNALGPCLKALNEVDAAAECYARAVRIEREAADEPLVQ